MGTETIDSHRLRNRPAAWLVADSVATPAQHTLDQGRPDPFYLGPTTVIRELVMPFAHDQYDNADRVRRLGCGRILRRARLAECSLARELEALLGNQEIAATARAEGRRVREERGASRATDVLLARFA